MKKQNKKIELRSETIRNLSVDDLLKACGGMRAQSNTDEMGACYCITQGCPTRDLACTWPDPPM